MTVLRSSAEPKGVLHTVGESSSLPEQYGADFLIPTPQGLVGVQRKTCADLIASTRGDDRIAREIGQSGALAHMVLIVEGNWRWDYRTPGTPSGTCPGVLKAQVDGMLLSFQVTHGWSVLSSASMADTARLVMQIASWFGKGVHHTLQQRQKSRGLWGTWLNEDWACHLLQAWNGIGVAQARAIRKEFETPPLAWTVSEEQLRAIPGIGPKRARALLAALDDGGIVAS